MTVHINLRALIGLPPKKHRLVVTTENVPVNPDDVVLRCINRSCRFWMSIDRRVMKEILVDGGRQIAEVPADKWHPCPI